MLAGDVIKQPAELPKPVTNQEAEKRLCGSNSSDKNEILFTEYGINYNNELEQFKKGTFIALPADVVDQATKPKSKEEKKASKFSYAERKINYRLLSQDIMKEEFWAANRYLIDS